MLGLERQRCALPTLDGHMQDEPFGNALAGQHVETERNGNLAHSAGA